MEPLSVLIGVPGSGKSTFANNFEKYLNQRSIQAENGTVMHESTENVDKAVGGEEDKEFQIVHVCYDNLIPLEVSEKMYGILLLLESNLLYFVIVA